MRSAARLARRFREVVDLVGAGRALTLTPRWLLHRQLLVLERDLCAPLPDLPETPGLRFHLLAPDERERLRAVNPAMDLAEVERRLAERQVCVVGWLNGEPVYYHWGASDSLFLTYLGLPLVLQPGDVFGDDAFTHPAARGQGIDAAGQLAYFRLAREQGARRYLGMVAVWNRSSLRVAEKLGRRPIALVDCRGPRPWQRCRVRGAARIERGVLTILGSTAREGPPGT